MGKYKKNRKAAEAFHEAAAAAAAAAAIASGNASAVATLKSSGAGNFIVHEQSMDDSLGVGSSRRSRCCNKECCLHVLRKMLTFLISRVGLMIIVIGYVLAGGLIIEALEADYERKALELSNRMLELMLQRIYRQIENNSTRVRETSFHEFLRTEIR